MIDFLLKSTISLIVFLGFYHLVLEREKMHQFNRFYLLFTIIISFVIPFLTFEIIKIVPVVQNFEPLNTVITSSAIPENEIQGTSLPIEEKINFMPYVLWSLYGIISFLLLIRFSKNIWKLIAKSKSNPNVKYKNANLVLVEEKTLPHTFLNSIFINFEDYNNRNIEDELYTHELVHVTQKHTLDILFIEFLKVIFWFNPIFIFYKKAIQLNHEFLADEEIVKTYNNVPFYQNLLLQKGSNNQTIYLASNLNYLVTKKRLIMMTKNTSQKIALLKKVAVVPILSVLVYFFCIEVVAQEKIIGTYSKNNNSEVTDKDKIRDSYYSGVYVNIIDERTNRKDVTLYENLSLEDKRKYLNLIPEIQIEKEIPALLFENLKSKNFKIGINNKLIKKEELKKYQRTDFSYYSCHMINKSERTKEFPQGYQYTLYTKEYFDKNMKNSQVHFKGDTIIIGNVSYQTAMKNKIVKTLKADTLVWYSEGKEGYNLYMNEKKEKKVIVIDAGHGGHDFGATIDDLNEKNLTSEIAKKIKEMHSDSNVEIHFTRTDDEFIALNERTTLINNIKPDLVISLHINNNKNTNSSGFEVYISDKTDFLDKNKEFAEKLSSKLSKTQLKNRGLKTAPFWILKNSICPSMVVELGFISNENDRNFIASEKGQTEIAKHIVAFISEVK
ncbi:N-acetylmuramoyl-L-alanine amidase [Flavobacterium sp.]|jgi:N-acetylmuramoyl-L-alanine amidase/beta-lactamase regulating signal transducer with metallopeptidase domain|uniref:N-acetylmuramoyl-L-alanine amidase n=1 Tax=Flavobacterium sp. TaxID=239 RepID=UPI0037C08B98